MEIQQETEVKTVSFITNKNACVHFPCGAIFSALSNCTVLTIARSK